MTGFHDLRLPERLRKRLAEPLGPICDTETARKELSHSVKLATCGDVVTENALKWGFSPFLALLDGKTQRAAHPPPAEVNAHPWAEVLSVKSAAGGLSAALQSAVQRLAKGRGGLIWVDGEEDLGVLPLLLELAEGSIVIYGQPGAGVCMVTVDARTKEMAQTLLQAMEAA